jgi:hypothetical protein
MNMIGNCPNCQHKLKVRQLVCDHCDLEMKGDFELSKFDFLDRNELRFIELFLSNQGNIKEMEKDLRVSYPTVKKLLEQIVRKLNLTLKGDNSEGKRRDIYERVAKKEITLEEAEKLLEE